MRKRVLIFMPSLPGGGAEKVLYDLIKNLDKNKYKVDLFLIYNEGYYKEKFKKLGIEINYLLNERKDIIKYFFYKNIKSFFINIVLKIVLKYPNILKRLREQKYDIEIAFLEGSATYLLANKFSEAKKIAWIHIDLEKHLTINRKLERESYLKYDKIVCVSEDVKKSAINLYPELKSKIEVIYNPIPKEEIITKALTRDKIYTDKKINLITVGRLRRQKGYDVLLKAHRQLLEEGFDYNLYILGEGIERENLEKYIKEKNMEKNTFLLGFKENPYPYIKQADIFISSSRYEGYPLVVCEALCLEKPIIATKCTGPSEILQEGRYGLLAEVENIESLKEKMKKMILNEEMRKKYSKLSSERAGIFDIEKTIIKIEKLLN